MRRAVISERYAGFRTTTILVNLQSLGEILLPSTCHEHSLFARIQVNHWHMLRAPGTK